MKNKRFYDAHALLRKAVWPGGKRLNARFKHHSVKFSFTAAVNF